MPAKDGEKTTLSLRVTPDMKRRLEDTGSETGRNLSQEAETRLEWSFQRQSLLNDTLNLAFGYDLGGLIYIIAHTMQTVGSEAAFVATGSLSGSAGWLKHPYGFNEGAHAAMTVLEAVRPKGEIVVPAKSKSRRRK